MSQEDLLNPTGATTFNQMFRKMIPYLRDMSTVSPLTAGVLWSSDNFDNNPPNRVKTDKHFKKTS